MAFFDRHNMINLGYLPVPLIKRSPVWVGITLLSLMGLVSVLLITHLGIGVSPDSITYIGGARNLIANLGFSFPTSEALNTPIIHYPPFYSLLLSSGGILRVDPLQTARWVNGFLFGANIFSVGAIVLSLQKQNSWKNLFLPVLASLIVFLSTTMLEIHVMAWSEPVFIFLGLLGFYFLTLYIETPRPLILISSAIVLSLASMSRYIGITFIVSGILGLLLFYRASLKRRLLDAVFFTVISTAPLMIWLLRNLAVAGTLTSREFAIHPIGKMHLGWALTTLSSWNLIPASANAIVKAIPLFLIALAFTWVILLNSGTSRNRVGIKSGLDLTAIPPMIKLFVTFILSYSLFLIFSITFLDANTPLDGRILSPVFVAGLIITLYTVGELESWISRKTGKRYFFQGIFIAVSGIFFISYLSPWLGLSRESWDNGIGFNNLAWKYSKTLSEVRQFPDDVNIYTNSPEAIYMGTGRAAKSLPKKFESMTQTENATFFTDLSEMTQELKDQGGVVVYFDRVQRPTLPSKTELMEWMDLQLISSQDDGVIYSFSNSCRYSSTTKELTCIRVSK